MDMRLRMCNIGSLITTGSLRTVAREFAKYKSNLVGLHRVQWDKGGTVPADDYPFCFGLGYKNQLGTGFFVPKGIISAVKG
jgi:hypothetical protein